MRIFIYIYIYIFIYLFFIYNKYIITSQCVSTRRIGRILQFRPFYKW